MWKFVNWITLLYEVQQTNSKQIWNDWNDSCWSWPYRRASAETSLNRSLCHSPSQYGWSAVPPWLALKIKGHHRSPGASWERAACCLFQVHNPHACSNLGVKDTLETGELEIYSSKICVNINIFHQVLQISFIQTAHN